MRNLGLSLILILFAAAVTFGAGFFVLQKNKTYSANILSPVESSLISRFDQVSERLATPIGPEKISNNEVTDFALLADSDAVLFYNSKTGVVGSVPIMNPSPSTGSTVIAKIKPNLKNVSWSYDGKKITARDKAGYVVYDLVDNKSKWFDSSLKELVLNKTDNSAAYFYFNDETGNGEAGIVDLNSFNFKSLFKTRSDRWNISWTSDDNVLLSSGSNPQKDVSFLLSRDGGLEKTIPQADDRTTDGIIKQVVSAHPTLSGIKDFKISQRGNYLVYKEEETNKLYRLYLGM